MGMPTFPGAVDGVSASIDVFNEELDRYEASRNAIALLPPGAVKSKPSSQVTQFTDAITQLDTAMGAML